MKVVAEANKYLSDQAPWKLKDDPARRETVLHTALQLVDDAKTLLTPFLPASSEQVHRMLGGETDVERAAGAARGRGPRRRAGATRCSWATTTPPPSGSSQPLRVGHPVAKPVPLFAKLEPSVVDEELARLEERA